jgi:uncharacterized delta-60 repeat protein
MSRPGVARLNADGSLDAGFDSALGLSFLTGSGSLGVGFKLAGLPDGKILIGGFFNTAGGIHRARVARLFGSTPAGELLELGEPVLNQTVRVGSAAALTIPLQSLWPVQSQWFRGFPDASPVPGATNAVLGFPTATKADEGPYELRVTLPGSGFVGGAHLLTVNPAGDRAGLPDPNSFTNAGANGTVYALLRLPSGRILIGGDFTAVDGKPRSGLARLFSDGSLDETFNIVEPLKLRVRCLAAEDEDHFLVGGILSGAKGDVFQLARVVGSGGIDTRFRVNAGVEGRVDSILIYTNGVIFIGGSFQQINGVIRGNLARLNEDGSVHAAFDGMVGANGPVYALARDGTGKIWVGGDFSTFDGKVCPGFARMLDSGALEPPALSLSAVPGGRVHAISTRRDGGVALAGQFAFGTGGEERALLQFSTTGELELQNSRTEAIGLRRELFAVAIQPDNKLVVGGSFSGLRFDVTSTGRHGLARIDSTATLDLAFDSEAGPEGFRSEESIRAIVLDPDGNLLVAGGFCSVAGLPRGGVTRIIGTNPPSAGFERPATLYTLGSYVTANEGQDRRITNRWNAPETPPTALSFSIDPGAPVGVSIDSATGIIAWTPTETQGPGTNYVTVRLRDWNSPSVESTCTWEIHVLEVNIPPKVEPVPAQRIAVGQTVTAKMKASDPDLPPNTLRFWFGHDAPAGAVLDPITGLFTWTPASTQVGIHPVEVIVADDAPTPGIAMARFEVSVVGTATQPFLAVSSFTDNELILRVSGMAGTRYDLESSEDLVYWELVDSRVMTADSTTFTVNVRPQEPRARFYRLRQP